MLYIVDSEKELPQKIVQKFYRKLTQKPIETEKFKFWKYYWESIRGGIGDARSGNTKKLKSFYGIEADNFDLAKFLYAVESFYALLIHIEAYTSLKSYDKDVDKLNLIKSLFEKEEYLNFGISNFGDSSLYTWFLKDLDEDDIEMTYDLYLEVINKKRERDTKNNLVTDELRDAYQALLPIDFRHSIGAYYTPDWLADYVLEKSKYVDIDKGDEPKKILDPHCGSGTFIVKAVSKLVKHYDRNGTIDKENLDWKKLLEENFRGYDLDPLAILAAKANYIKVAASLKQKHDIDIFEGEFSLPFYVCDSIYFPPHTISDESSLFTNESIKIRIGPKFHDLPANVVLDEPSWNRFIDIISSENSVTEIKERIQSKYSITDSKILKNVENLIKDINEYQISSETYFDLLKDSVRPIFDKKFDIVVGNPPWINWENLSTEYRDIIKPIWPKLGLFDSDSSSNKIFSKEELAVLATYVAADQYLKDGGILGFLIPQSIFKSTLNSRGFRGFNIDYNKTPLKVVEVDDLTNANTFYEATNRASILFLKKGEKTQYPVNYMEWENKVPMKISLDSNSWSDISDYIKINSSFAEPIDKDDLKSNWMHGSKDFLESMRNLSGNCPYKARTGVFTGGANAIYYMNILDCKEDGILVSNVTKRAKNKVEKVELELEKDYIYPFLRGRNVDFWHAEIDKKQAILCPHNKDTAMKPVAEEKLENEAPRTYEYLSGHKNNLLNRGGLTGIDQPSLEVGFYTLCRIGDYTFAPYKVLWKYISKTFKCCVVETADICGSTKPILPQEKLVTIGFSEPQEAYYTCGVLSSDIVRSAIHSRMVGTSISVSIIDQLGIPKFDESNENHIEISRNCQIGHSKNKAGEDYMENLETINELTFQILK